MSNIDTTDVVLAGLGIGGFVWMNHRLASERRARLAAEQARDCAHACAVRAQRPANGGTPASARKFELPRLASRAFDQIFAAYGQGIPVPYLRALALRESSMNPRSASGPAWGLLQVIEVVREDYNQRTGARYTRQDLLDPVVNVAIAASTLATIVHSYARNHPRVRNLQPDWNNPRFVELLTFGWNAGWSERGGVGRVATYLEQRGVFEQTIDTIHKASRDAGASTHLANALKVTWSKSVAAQYFRERAADVGGRTPVIEMPDDYVGRPPLVATGPITQPSQVATTAVSQPAHASATPAPAAVPQVVLPSATVPDGQPVMVATMSPPPSQPLSIGNPSGAGGPINPYGDCNCSS